MKISFDTSEKHHKFPIKSYSNRQKSYLDIPNRFAIIGILTVITFISFYAFTFVSNSSSKPAAISETFEDQAMQSATLKPTRQNETDTNESIKADFPTCETSQPSFSGNKSFKCMYENADSITYEYFDSEESIALPISEYALVNHPENESLSIRVGPFQDINRLLFADVQNLRIVDIQSKLDQQELMKWLENIYTSKAPVQPE